MEDLDSHHGPLPGAMRDRIAASVGLDALRPPPIGWSANCASFAFYVVGLIQLDEYRDSHSVFEKFSEFLVELDSPVEGCLVGWQRTLARTDPERKPPGSFVHWAVVSSLDPVCLVHRPECDGDVESDLLFADLNEQQDEGTCHVRYFKVDLALKQSVTKLVYPERTILVAQALAARIELIALAESLGLSSEAVRSVEGRMDLVIEAQLGERSLPARPQH